MEGVADVPLRKIDRSILGVPLPDLLEDAGEARAKLHCLRGHIPVSGDIDSRGVLAGRRNKGTTTGRRSCRVADEAVLPIGLRHDGRREIHRRRPKSKMAASAVRRRLKP